MTGVQWHPAWCDTKRCEATLSQNGAHTSTPRVIAPDDLSTARVQVRMWRSPAFATYVELTVGDHATGHRIRADLSLNQARRLRTALAEVLVDAGNAPAGRTARG